MSGPFLFFFLNLCSDLPDHRLNFWYFDNMSKANGPRMKQGRVDKIGTNRTASGGNEFAGPGIEVTKESNDDGKNNKPDRADSDS